MQQITACVDCGMPASSANTRCDDCLTEVTETPDWCPPPGEGHSGGRSDYGPLGRGALGPQGPNIRRERIGPDRQARCGHSVPWHPGPLKRRCSACSARPARACPCGADITNRRGPKFCSTRCGEIARGTRLPEPLPERTCALAECDTRFRPFRAGQRCCCEKHGKLLYNRESRADGRQPMVSGDPARRRARLRIKTQLRRARTRTDEAEKVDRDAVGDRDGWKCGICRRKVNQALPYPDLRSPSLDHVVPLSQGGAHIYANVRISHLRCNNLRSNRGGGEQLALI